MATVVVSRNGPPCPSCARPMQAREHGVIGPKQLRKRYYYRRWFYCTYRDCRTTLVMRDEDQVWNKEEDRRLQLIRQQLRPRE